VTLKLLLLLVLLALSAFFSGTETAYFSLDRLGRRRLSTDPRGRMVLRLLGKPDRLLSAVLFGNTLVNVAASAVATVMIAEILPGSLGLGIAVLLMTFLLLVFGEISPKTYAIAKAEAWARNTSGVMRVFMTLCSPVTAVLSGITRIAARAAGVTDRGEELSSEEVLSLMELGQTEGVLGAEAKITVAFLTLNEKQCDQAMVSRSGTTVLRKSWSRERMLSVVRSTEHTRYPLIGGPREDVLGFIDAREFLTDDEHLQIHDIPVLPETAPLGDVLEELRSSGSSIGAVFDEYGDWTGMITVDDILEAVIFHHLTDNSSLPPGVVRRAGGFDIPATIRVEHLSELIGSCLRSEYAETAGGLLEEITGRIPSVGEWIDLAQFRIQVLEAEGPRLERLHIVKRCEEEEPC